MKPKVNGEISLINKIGVYSYEFLISNQLIEVAVVFLPYLMHMVIKSLFRVVMVSELLVKT